jgi:hypothetical protein
MFASPERPAKLRSAPSRCISGPDWAYAGCFMMDMKLVVFENIKSRK